MAFILATLLTTTCLAGLVKTDIAFLNLTVTLQRYEPYNPESANFIGGKVVPIGGRLIVASKNTGSLPQVVGSVPFKGVVPFSINDDVLSLATRSVRVSNAAIAPQFITLSDVGQDLRYGRAGNNTVLSENKATWSVSASAEHALLPRITSVRDLKVVLCPVAPGNWAQAKLMVVGLRTSPTDCFSVIIHAHPLKITNTTLQIPPEWL